MPTILSVESLVKKYRVPQLHKGFWGSVRSLLAPQYQIKMALDRVSFQLKEGELVGYIGPNGAGKSTSVKILSGILVPDGGTAQVLGKTPWHHRTTLAREIGVVFGQRTQLWWELQVEDSFKLLKAIYEIPEARYRNTLNILVDRFDLANLLHVPVRQLSLGQRMRCDLAASLLHAPKMLFLDEPTIGLDAVSKLAIRDFIRHLNKEEGVTILLTTHDLDDIEALCQRIIVLDQGAIYFDGTMSALRKKVLPERRLVIDLVQEEDFVPLEHTTLVKREGHRIWLKFNPQQLPPPTLIARITAQYAISDLFVENPPIEELVAHLYRSRPL